MDTLEKAELNAGNCKEFCGHAKAKIKCQQPQIRIQKLR